MKKRVEPEKKHNIPKADEDKKSLKERINSMSNRRKAISLVVILLVLAIPVAAIGYRSSHNKTTKAITGKNKNGKSASQSSNNSSNDKSGNSSNNMAVQSRLERFNKDDASKRIDQAVKNKSITDAQAKLLYKKLAEIDKLVSSNKSKSSQEQTQLAIAKRKDLLKWARDNNIPTRYVAGWI